ncbi:MAG: peptidoglycan DD-metalloendopeptidase family protein [Bacteroidales bacterium]|jgi:murein DD-endopeptidase MepM/ murein hydrolase activator NlpD|nr:peptidoglycan DD-metalloendopeptidase family protein [Bacteroidales bacterium]NMD02023.1 M23 family metallopeptidase [Bacteroidales bacterium]OQB62280.1 MAG: Murein hydrolase activator EnvC precursor [Bacteroidetes bacterium ADurb.Bin145]HOU02822.1 M23 family metallopeptidase [Bacteroidales bacterium]HQK67795.1 M23 family metallopeptidase [Bacteroidales bacterium]
MAKNDKKKRNWRDKYRFSIVNDTTFEEVWRVRLTQYNAFLLITGLVLFIIGATVSLIAFTNLREFIPGYPDVTMRRNILMSAIRLDSLDKELEMRDKYFANMNAIISGKEPADFYSVQDTTGNYRSIVFKNTPEDSALRARVENEEKYNLTLGPSSLESVVSLAGLHFFPPVKGIISGRFDERTKHFGTDIVAKPKSSVSAVLDGTVIFTGWTMETGFVIQIQHTNNIVSIYKHNASLLKETGDLVKAGEPISIIGNSGELYTSGPHLHFEIWYKGSPLDPEKHILF